MLKVEVAYACTDAQLIVEVEVEEGATIGQAIHQSGILQKFPEIDLAKNKVGIFGRQVSLLEPLRAGDRVEIYRGLIADPKLARRLKAKAG